MCGRQGPLASVDIEGVILSVCKNCASMGRIVGGARPAAPIARKKAIPAQMKIDVDEPVPEIIEDAAAQIKAARERLGLSFEELGKRVGERVSVLQKVESGHLPLNIDLAKRLEKALRVKLVEMVDQKSGSSTVTSSEGLTIGDIIKMKK